MRFSYKKSMVLALVLGLMLAGISPGYWVYAAENRGVDQVMYYTVQPGDNLWTLARNKNIDIKTLASLNELDDESLLKIGQVLKIPMEQLITHEVQKGETIWRIARNYHVDWRTVMRENEMSDPRELLAGQRLVIPIPSERVSFTLAPVRQFWRFGFWPVVGQVSSLYGLRDGRMHYGLDIAAPEGTPIYSVKDGVVEFAGDKGTYGKAVIIRHGDEMKTLYAHASEILVTEGERVESGQVVALVGNTGRSTGPHVHFEVVVSGKHIDPVACLPVLDQ